jgi:xanthine dehydrogenase accessory factor
MDTGDIIDCMARMKGDHQPFAVATVIRTEDATSAKAGAKAVIRADGTMIGWIGGGCALGAAKTAAAQALLDGRSRLIRVEPGEPTDMGDGREPYRNVCPSGGTIELFIEPVLPRTLMVIMGASPTALALCDLAKRVGFAVTVAAQAPDHALFGQADTLISGFEIGDVPRIESAYVIVATQGKRDFEALRAAMTTKAAYVALVASRRKAEVLMAQAIEAGVAPERVAGLKAPAGIDIGAATPEEIAVAVLADVIRERRARPEPVAADFIELQPAASPAPVPAVEPSCCED